MCENSNIYFFQKKRQNFSIISSVSSETSREGQGLVSQGFLSVIEVRADLNFFQYIGRFCNLSYAITCHCIFSQCRFTGCSQAEEW